MGETVEIVVAENPVPSGVVKVGHGRDAAGSIRCVRIVERRARREPHRPVALVHGAGHIDAVAKSPPLDRAEGKTGDVFGHGTNPAVLFGEHPDHPPGGIPLVSHLPTVRIGHRADQTRRVVVVAGDVGDPVDDPGDYGLSDGKGGIAE